MQRVRVDSGSDFTHAKQAVLEWKQCLFVCVLNRAEPCPSGNQPLVSYNSGFGARWSLTKQKRRS